MASLALVSTFMHSFAEHGLHPLGSATYIHQTPEGQAWVPV